jgi:hypothetical protein
VGEFALMLLAQIVGALVASLLSAAVLIWRARKLKNWPIPFRSAYVVAAIAAVAGIISANVIALIISFASDNVRLLESVGRLFGLVVWWFVHSRALMKLAGTAVPLTVKEARSISASVFAYLFGIVFALAVAGMLILLAVSGMRGH